MRSGVALDKAPLGRYPDRARQQARNGVLECYHSYCGLDHQDERDRNKDYGNPGMRQATWDADSESSRQQVTILSQTARTVSDIDGHPGLPLAQRANITDRSNLVQKVLIMSHTVSMVQVTAVRLRFLPGEKSGTFRLAGTADSRAPGTARRSEWRDFTS
jgi:hypothetical protein